MDPLKPSKLLDKFLNVFSYTECTQNLEKRDGSFEHVLNLICVQQICSKCEALDDLIFDCEQFGKRIIAFWQDTVVKIFRLSPPVSIIQG